MSIKRADAILDESFLDLFPAIIELDSRMTDALAVSACSAIVNPLHELGRDLRPFARDPFDRSRVRVTFEMVHLPAHAPRLEPSIGVELYRTNEVAVAALKTSVDVLLHFCRQLREGQV